MNFNLPGMTFWCRMSCILDRKRVFVPPGKTHRFSNGKSNLRSAQSKMKKPA